MADAGAGGGQYAVIRCGREHIEAIRAFAESEGKSVGEEVTQ